jgi:competence protein ComGC
MAMKAGQASKSSLFLMEMVIALLFFSICSAICIRVFAAASQDTVCSRNLSSASSLCQSAAEVYKACRGNIEKTAEILDGGYKVGQAKVYYDSDWNITQEQDNAEFVLLIEDDGTEGCVKGARIYAEKCSGHNAGECIFSIKVKTLEDII